MQKFKNAKNDIVKLKLFPFSLRGKDKKIGYFHYLIVVLIHGTILEKLL
jgi:hypothetical protein